MRVCTTENLEAVRDIIECFEHGLVNDETFLKLLQENSELKVCSIDAHDLEKLSESKLSSKEYFCIIVNFTEEALKSLTEQFLKKHFEYVIAKKANKIVGTNCKDFYQLFEEDKQSPVELFLKRAKEIDYFQKHVQVLDKDFIKEGSPCVIFEIDQTFFASTILNKTFKIIIKPLSNQETKTWLVECNESSENIFAADLFGSLWQIFVNKQFSKKLKGNIVFKFSEEQKVADVFEYFIEEAFGEQLKSTHKNSGEILCVDCPER